MKTKSLGVSLALVLLSALNALALTRYVNVSNPTPAAPYTSWATAATNIQSAIDAATAGDLILVTNGVYQKGGRVVYGSLTNRVAINKAVTVQSVNGPVVTVIKGYQVPGTTNGNGAVRCVYLTNGASLSGFTLTNGATRAAGDVYREQSGGGVWSESADAVITRCVLAGNSAYRYGGGAYDGTLNNSIMTRNSGYYGAGAYSSTLNNCTLVGNSAGFSGGGARLSTLNNCIVYLNTVASGSTSNYFNGTLNYCCTAPMPAAGSGNITNSPLFMDQAGGNLRLQSNSPCVNAGNNAYAPAGPDLDGNPRISGGTVDIGAYEFQQTPPSITTQPTDQTASVGGSAAFSVTASGTVPLGYFWRRNGTPIAGANSSNYTTNNVQLADSGSQFSCLVSNAYGTALSSNAVLMVNLQPIHYVSLNSTNPVVPYLSWATAATNIQDAIDVTFAGDLVLVSNGVYATGWRWAGSAWQSGKNRVAVTNAVTVRSVNGPALTIIQGELSLIRCAYLINGAVLSGFTLTNGFEGVMCESTSVVITNTVIINCINDGAGGGGACNGTLNNCTLTGNTDSAYGGGAYICTLNNCLLTGNFVLHGSWTCLSDSRGGGAFGCTLNNCMLTGNSAGYGGGSYSSTLNNCTLVGNYAFSFHCGETVIGGGVGGGSCGDTLNNCIIYYNNSDQSSPNANVASTLNYCCTPNPGGGVGNITFEPRFVDLANGNLRLQSNSPCINAGNNSYVIGSTDLDGNPRIFGGTVDIGAYEFQGTGNVGFVAWLQQYGLPTDGSADYTDPDGDGLNNWQEWYAGTVPTNAASVLKMAAASNTVSGVTVSWQSVTNRTYFLQRSTNLGVTPAFSTIQTNIAGQAGTTSYTDTTAANGGPNFYRVGVQLAP